MMKPGTVLADRYLLARLAWTALRGQVWKATDRTLDRPVYLLMLDESIAQDKTTRRAFIDEAGALATRSHPGIAAIYDIGLDPPFVVMEDPGGGRLSDRLAQGRLDPTSAARIISNLARAMQAYPDGVDDIDPERIVLAPDGRAKISPLGMRSVITAPASPRELASLAVRLLTGHEPAEKLSKRELPHELAPVLAGLIAKDPAVSLEDLVTACATLTRPESLPRGRRERRKRRGGGDLGWLFGVTAIVALAVVAVVLGPRLIDQQSVPSPGATATDTRGPAGAPLEVIAIRDFDPDGNGEEHPEQVARILDGDPLTAWSTLGYRQVGMDKAGVGVLLDLGSSKSLSALRVQTSLSGWKAEIRVADADGETAGDFATVAAFTAGTDETIAVPKGTTARFVLVWLIELADDEGASDYPYRASIAEVAVLR